MKAPNMTTLNFNIPLISLDGNPEPSQTLAKILSDVIGTEPADNIARIYKLNGWYKTLRDKETLSLDESDLVDLKKIIEVTARIFVFVKYQLLEVIQKAK